MNQKRFASLIIIVIATLVIGAGIGGFLLLPEKKIPSYENEKTVQQEVSFIEPTPLRAEPVGPSSLPASSESGVKPKPTIPLTPNQNHQNQDYEVQTRQPRDPWKDPLPPVPANLALPFTPKDIRKTDGLISPYGLVRHSRDTGVGHGGIDFPLEFGSSIYAVVDGTIIKNEKEDNGGGNTVDVLILPNKFLGEGWIFKYEHITLEPELMIENRVQKGQKIGINALKQGDNNHIGLEYHIKNFTIARTKICWVDLLEPTVRQQLEDEFNQTKKTQAFLESWQTANEEGYYQYKGLLDKTKYPDGPQLCYILGTDARISVNMQ